MKRLLISHLLIQQKKNWRNRTMAIRSSFTCLFYFISVEFTWSAVATPITSSFSPFPRCIFMVVCFRSSKYNIIKLRGVIQTVASSLSTSPWPFRCGRRHLKSYVFFHRESVSSNILKEICKWLTFQIITDGVYSSEFRLNTIIGRIDGISVNWSSLWGRSIKLKWHHEWHSFHW